MGGSEKGGVRPARPHPEISWSGWGDPAEATVLPAAVAAMLEQVLGARGSERPPATLSEVRLPKPSLSRRAHTALATAVGADNVLDDPETRVRHARGKSTPDLLRLRAGDGRGAPDLVVRPDTHEEVLAVLRNCAEHRVAVVPFGGGTSVVGGVEARTGGLAGAIALDLRRLNRLVEVDEESRTATLEPGLRGPQAEELLADRGYTIGHHPQSFEYATIGGFAAARSSGQASAGYGRFDDRVVAMTVATPRGSLGLRRAPKSAAGPDLRQVILGSEGALGVITSVTVEIRPIPAKRIYEGWRFPTFADGVAALRGLAQDGPMPSVLRLSDEAETALGLAGPGELGAGGDGGCLAVTGYEGGEDEVAARRDRATATLRERGAEPDPEAGERWAGGRYRGPYLRDALLDAGVLVETLETATFWSRLAGLYGAVGDALRESLGAQGTPPAVLCHVSHVYASGASLYFTVGAAQLDDPVAQWWRAKGAASDAILAAGGSISHHHGVGADHRPWYEREIGPLAVEALRAVKATVDPAGVMNPGVLIP